MIRCQVCSTVLHYVRRYGIAFIHFCRISVAAIFFFFLEDTFTSHLWNFTRHTKQSEHSFCLSCTGAIMIYVCVQTHFAFREICSHRNGKPVTPSCSSTINDALKLSRLGKKRKRSKKYARFSRDKLLSTAVFLVVSALGYARARISISAFAFISVELSNTCSVWHVLAKLKSSTLCWCRLCA